MAYESMFIWECRRCFLANIAFIRPDTESGEVLRLTCEHCGWQQRKEYQLPADKGLEDGQGRAPRCSPRRDPTGEP